METPFAAAQRLLTAFEELVSQEALALRAMEFDTVVTLRDQAAPLVERLCSLAGETGVRRLQSRVDAVLERSRQNAEFLAGQLAQVSGELNRLQEARGRVRHVAPAYQYGRSRHGAGESRLNVAA